MKLRKKALSLVLAFTMVASVFAIPVTASAATLTWSVPTKAMEVDDSIVKVAGHAANTTTVHYLGGNLITARSNRPTSTEYPQSVKYIAAEFGIYGSNLTESPDPYMWNHLYNLVASEEDKVAEFTKPVTANPMGADLTPVSGYEALTITGTDQVPHSIGMKADVLLGTNGSNGKTYDDYIALMADDYDPIQVAYKASNLADFIDDMYNLSDAIVKSGKSGRYGDTAEIANNYEAYIKGLQLYVISQIDAGAVEKKTIAIINSTPNADGTYTAYTSSISVGTAASCRAAEYIETTTNNVIDVLGIENTGSDANAQYLLTAEQLLNVDAIYTTVQANNTTGETFRQQLKDTTGCTDEDIPPVYSHDPAGIFGIQMNSVENIAGIGIYQGFLYPEILNPVYAYTYIVENFYHVTEPKNYKAVTETLLADCSLPAGYEADASGYTTDYIDSKIDAGLNYYYNNQEQFAGLKVEPTDRLEFTPTIITDINETTIAAIADQVYTGSKISPAVTVTDGETVLVEGTDYTIAYSNNTNVGTATATITGIGSYDGTKEVTFNITAKSIAKATVATIAKKTYTGKAIKPAPAVKVNGKTLKKGTDYTIAYKANVNPGKATVTITGKGNYTGKVTKTFNISPAKATVKKVTSLTKGTLKVTWKKQNLATGYQVVVAKNKAFTNGKKVVNVAKTKTVKATFKNLTKGKTYYVKVRAYKKVGNTKVFGPWSAVKTKTVKK